MTNTEITQKITNLNTFFEKTKNENSRLEGTLEPIEKELMSSCGTTDITEITKILETKKVALEKTKGGIASDLQELEGNLKEYGYTPGV